MSALNIAQVEKFEILPSNQPANNTYSFKDGNPIITFNIGSTNKLLRPSSLRINGRITILDGDGKQPGNGALNQGRQGGAATTAQVQFNPRVGVNGIFQNINISSNDTNQTLESVRQYGRMVASVMPSTHSTEDFLNNSGVVELNPGIESVAGALNNNTCNFGLRLFAGMMNGGNAIPLGVNGVRGLAFSLELCSDQMLLSGADAAASNGASYKIDNLSMTGDLLVPDAEGQQKLAVPGNGSFQYNSYNNLYSVIDANDATQTYNLAQSNVLNVFHNFLPVSHANNYAQDSFATAPPLLTNAAGTTYTGGTALINKVSFSRGGMKLGLDYDLDVAQQSQENRPQTGVAVNALNAIQPFSNITHLTNQPLLLNYGGNDQVIYDADGLQKFTSVDAGKRNFAVGLAIDNVSQVGVDFRGQSYATRIQSSLDGKSPNAVYTYVMSKNSLVYSPQGIMVQS
tara:strand:- start:1098 stop:2468 length:1371 start_codon:yes stop_codon:yes gene_type:complete